MKFRRIMSDESDSPDSKAIVIHRPAWRSQSKFVYVLQGRIKRGALFIVMVSLPRPATPIFRCSHGKRGPLKSF